MPALLGICALPAPQKHVSYRLVELFLKVLGNYCTWTSKRAQNNGPISRNREYGQYRVHHIGHFGGPGKHLWAPGRDCRTCLLETRSFGFSGPSPLQDHSGLVLPMLAVKKRRVIVGNYSYRALCQDYDRNHSAAPPSYRLAGSN